MRGNGTTISRPGSREISYFNVSVLICNSLEMGMVLPPTLKLRPVVNTKLVLYSHVCAPYTNATPTVRGLTADNNNKLYTETMILWNNHYNLNFIM